VARASRMVAGGFGHVDGGAAGLALVASCARDPGSLALFSASGRPGGAGTASVVSASLVGEVVAGGCAVALLRSVLDPSGMAAARRW
jgi:hypothetical protein